MNRILAIDDDQAVLRYLQVFFLQEGRFETRVLSDSTQALAAIEEFRPELLLLDIDMPEVTGIDILRQLAARPERPEVVILSGVEDIKLAVEAMKLGAYDYLTKPVDTTKLLLTIDRALERRNMKSELDILRRRVEEAGEDQPFARIITRCPKMLDLFRRIELVAPTDNAVLLWGESGTGKELVAKAVHRLSRRAGASFIAVNAGVFAAEIFASEFFGHTRGAFTGAVADKRGIIEQCDGGTLFLDEIGELPLSIQVKLLRVLQEGEYTQVGSTQSRRANVRLVTATNKDLRVEIERGSFRSDLFYRLDVCSVHLPPLRERTGDIALLAQYFVDKYAKLHGRKVCRLAGDVASLLEQYPYPGNVRELENLINGAVLLETSEELTRGALPPDFLTALGHAPPPPPPTATTAPGAERSLAEVEREHIEKVLHECGGNRSAAARILGISRVTLIAKIKQFGLP